LSSPSYPLELPTGSAPRLPARLAILGALLVVELLVISIWLDAEALRGRGLLAGIVHDWGAWTVRLSVAVMLGTLIFAESRGRSRFAEVSAAAAAFPIRIQWLAAHAALMGSFLWLSAAMFREGGAGLSNALMIAWGVLGTAGFVFAALALIPPAIWLRLFRVTGDAWIYGCVGALAASLLGTQAQKLWVPLSHLTFDLAAAMLRPFYPALKVLPATLTIATPSFEADIAPTCSGYEGMGLILAFSAAWLWFYRRQWKFPQALILLPAGVAIMFVVNAARIAALIAVGSSGLPRIAEGGFHSQAGWMAFNAVAIGMCVIARNIPALSHQEHAGAETDNPTVPYLMPFLAILGAAMVARAASGGFEWFYGLRVLAAAVALWIFRHHYKSLDFRFSGWGVAAGAAVFALWIALEPRGAHAAAPQALLDASAGARLAWIAARIVGAVVFVPIAEELAFRGFLLRRLISADFDTVPWKAFAWGPLLISSAAFGLLHGERWVAGVLAGVIFALVQIRRGRIGEAVAAHAVANILVAVWVLIGGNWQLW
jgi:exosortase E/protease (VPEID-CTERM system)